MRTYSHFLITALIWDILHRRNLPMQCGRAFLIGSILPDIPLMILTVWFLIHRFKTDNPPTDGNPLYGPEYDNYYYHNDIWKLLTSLFHAPFLIVGYASIAGLAWIWSYSWAEPFLWLSASCGLHSFIDCLTHVEDGILILFPFNWNYRLHSWVSYYDPNYGGDIFTVFEFGLDGLLLLYFMYRGLDVLSRQKRMARYIEVQQYVLDNPIV